jgi:hypothetical protein
VVDLDRSNTIRTIKEEARPNLQGCPARGAGNLKMQNEFRPRIQISPLNHQGYEELRAKINQTIKGEAL